MNLSLFCRAADATILHSLLRIVFRSWIGCDSFLGHSMWLKCDSKSTWLFPIDHYGRALCKFVQKKIFYNCQFRVSKKNLLSEKNIPAWSKFVVISFSPSEHFSFDHNLILHKSLSHVMAIRAVTIGSLAQRIWIYVQFFQNSQKLRMVPTFSYLQVWPFWQMGFVDKTSAIKANECNFANDTPHVVPTMWNCVTETLHTVSDSHGCTLTLCAVAKWHHSAIQKKKMICSQ